jgi:hypothetical protein
MKDERGRRVGGRAGLSLQQPGVMVRVRWLIADTAAVRIGQRKDPNNGLQSVSWDRTAAT